MKRIIALLLVFVMMLGLAACCKKESVTFAAYDASQDEPFLPKDIYSADLYAPGIALGLSGQYSLDITNNSNNGSFVLAGEFGKCYEIKVPAGVSVVRAARFTVDPRTLAVDTAIPYQSDVSLKNTTSTAEGVNFMYTCRNYNEYLVVYTGSSDPIYIGERSILEKEDTNGPWYVPESVGSLIDDKTFGDANWGADEILDKLYEPVRERYPKYITRSTIGKDASGLLDMYCYEYTPEDYEITMFLAGGMHGDEGVGYFSLAKIMQLIADATPEDTLLYTLRQKVRFVVLPIINVYGATHGKTRKNAAEQDLNRDFDELTQQETKNVMDCFAKYADDVCMVMDFHIADSSAADVALYFNFINYADNAVANLKSVNHMYHRYKELEIITGHTNLAKVPGSYVKGSQYFEGRIWNQYKVPTITVEYITTKKFPKAFTDECMTLAVETYMNFIIQNALFYIQAK